MSAFDYVHRLVIANLSQKNRFEIKKIMEQVAHNNLYKLNTINKLLENIEYIIH